MQAPVTKRALRKAATKAAVLSAARDEFRAQGYDRAKIVDIAKSAGVSPGTVLNAAPTKIALLCEVMVDDFESLSIDTRTLTAALTGPLHTCITAVLDLHLERHLRGLELMRAAIGYNWLDDVEDFQCFYKGLELVWAPIHEMLSQAESNATLPVSETPDMLTDTLFDMYLGVLRRCAIYGYDHSEASALLHRRLKLILPQES